MLLGLLLWLALLGLALAAAVALAGDALLSVLLRLAAPGLVGDKFSLRWSLRAGSLELRDLAVSRAALPALEPLAGLPMDLERLEMKQFLFVLPVFDRLVHKTPLESTVQISGLRVAVSLNTPEKWMWSSEENAERCRQAIAAAAKARVQRVQDWTAGVVQKLKDLAALRKASSDAKKQVAKAEHGKPAAAQPALWHKIVDEVIDSFSIVTRSFSLTIRDEDSGAGMGIALEEFELGRSGGDGPRRKRLMRLEEFMVFLNAKPGGSADACYLVSPLSMQIVISMPYICQGLLAGVGSERALKLEIAFADTSEVSLQLRPVQIKALLGMLRVINQYYDWQAHAKIADEDACVELTPEESEEYLSLYCPQWKFDNETGFFMRMYKSWKFKEDLSLRRARLEGLESKVLASRLLYLRSLSLEWDVPEAGTPLPYTGDDVLQRGALRRFITNPLDKYVKELPETEPMFHRFEMGFTMTKMELLLLADNEAPLLTFFANDFTLDVGCALAKVEKNEKSLVVGLEITRFGMLDKRNAHSNVFHQLMDKNPGTQPMLRVHLVQNGDGLLDISVTLSDFTMLLVFDPLMATMHSFLPALDEDEVTQMRFLACEPADPSKSPELRDEATPLYIEDLPQEYSPLLLGGSPMSCKIKMKGCEFCLLGDSSTLKSHVLAFTSDFQLDVTSSAHHESIEMELVDVALVPCTVILRDDGIELDIGDVRSILELEGEGVDLSLGYRLTVGNPKPRSRGLSQESKSESAKKPAANLWGVARSAISKKQIVEVEHPDVEKAEETAAPPSQKERTKIGARRKLSMQMSDFALNFSPNDLGVLLSIGGALSDSMKEDVNVVRERTERTERIDKARRDLEERRYLAKLKEEFKMRDVDGGGSLDATEISGLLKSATNCDNLTKDEFDATVQEFLRIVDSDGSGDVSMEEFESALRRDKVLYSRVHRGVVSITGQEYVDPSMERNRVPYLSGDLASSIANSIELAAFWKTYEEQVGASRTSLNGLPVSVVQKKMVRTFKNYEYAQEAWYRLVNPSLVKPGDQSAWVLTKEMDMGSRGDTIDQLLSSLGDDNRSAAPVHRGPVKEMSMYVQTVISTSFGGFYLRMIDDMLPRGVPAIEISLEELVIYGNFSAWEGGAVVGGGADFQPERRSKNNCGVGKVSFDVYGNYYNLKARQVEPFMEYYQGILDLKKDPASQLDVIYSSDRYLQLNITSAFMEVLNTNVANFSKAEKVSKRVRPHIREEDGLFWMLNESGVNIKYFLVAKREEKKRTKEEIVTSVSNVAPGQAHACKLLNVSEELKDYEQQSLKEKQLRAAFRSADADGSGELDADEVRTVLREVYAEEERQQRSRGSSLYRRSDSATQSEQDLDRMVDDFIALADTDNSGLVSWDEFKIAISKSRATVDRFISLDIEGFEPVGNIPLSSIGQTQVYELVPRFEDVEAEKSIAALYEEGIGLLTKIEAPTRRELHRAYACLRRVKEMDPFYEWIDSYYAECMRKYLPVLVAINIFVDGSYGLQVKVSGAEFIRNGTAKNTECLLLDGSGDVAWQNPPQPSGEAFFVLPANGSICIPLDLVDAGSFAIRQIGEKDWSNFLPLSVAEQRLYKTWTHYEQLEAQKVQRGDVKSSISTSKTVEEKLGSDVMLPDVSSRALPGSEVVYPSTSLIDNQPTTVIEKISVNNPALGTWSLVIQPQLILNNVLPCAIEYAIVQADDCPRDTLDNKGEFRGIPGTPSSKKSRTPKTPASGVDYFEFVNEVNSRKMLVESGKSIQVFGLDLSRPALMKVRLCASESDRCPVWSAPFTIHLDHDRDAFSTEAFELRFNDGPGCIVQPKWEADAARTVVLYAPYWIQNRSGLDLRFKVPKGYMCSVEEHRTYFPFSRDVPIMAVAPLDKALISVKPYQETPSAFEAELPRTTKHKKYLPNFEKLGWTEAQDMASVGTKGELRQGSGDSLFVLSFEVRAAPGQFFRSKIMVISPRYVVVSRVPRPFQVTPLLLDKKGYRSKSRIEDSANCTLKHDESVIVYRLSGSEKYVDGIRLRDIVRDETVKTVGEWSPTIPLFKVSSQLSEPNVTSNLAEDTDVWTRDHLGDGPVYSVSVQALEEIVYAEVKDISSTPRYRIENRSTKHSFRYAQYGMKGVEEITIGPLESHSYAWDDPKADLRLKVTPVTWKVPTVVDFMQIGEVSGLTPTNVHAEVYIDGPTRVFALGDTKCYADIRQRAFLSDWLTNVLIDVVMHGVGITLVDSEPQEILNITMENIRFSSAQGSRTCVFSVHHVQLDDMTSQSAYPVVMAPTDSGFNSDKREGWLPEDGERPFMRLSIDSSPQTGITLVNEFDLQLHSLAVKLNLEYVIGLGNLLFQFIPPSDDDTVMQQGIDTKAKMLAAELPTPDPAASVGMLLYFKQWRMSEFEFDLVFDSVQEDKGEGISAFLGPTLGSVVGGIAHVTPHFSFGEITYTNRFFYEYDLIYDVVLKIVYSVVGQWYKIVGSVELLGDPIGLATDIVDGFALAARQLKRDVRGKSRRKGESALTVVQTVFGAPLLSISKVSNGLGDVVKKAVHFKSQEDPNQPRHVPEGIVQGGAVFSKSLAYGVVGFVKEPIRGAKRDGVKGFARGVGRGTMQLVVSPVVGTLGAVEKLSQSVHNTTHLLDEKHFEGTRRPARNLTGNPLKQLTDSNIITEVEVHCVRIEGLPENSNPKVVVRTYTQPSGSPAQELEEFKSTTKHRTGSPTFNESWLISISSPDTFIEVDVYHKRKPLPKKLLGFVRFSLEDIYREFDAVPAKLLADTNAKLRLKRRKRVRGSILSELAQSSGHSIAVRDDSWRQRLSRPKTGSSLSAGDLADEDEDAFDDYEEDAGLLLSQPVETGETFPPRPVELELRDCESGAKIFLSIRYVNDMRRYA